MVGGVALVAQKSTVYNMPVDWHILIMTPRNHRRYTAAELGQLAGLTERTVRYYVQEHLIDAPDGRGRGAHYDDRHLGQLRRVRLLQSTGLDHAAIRRHNAETRELLEKRGLSSKRAELAWTNFNAQAAALYSRAARSRELPSVDLVTRIGIAKGIELLVDRAIRLPSPTKLVQVVEAVCSAFRTEGKEE